MVLILSAFLMATGAMVMERLVSSINQLFDEAKPPHFLQMHKGDYDEAALQSFADQHPEIQSWLIEKMDGFDSATISWNRPGAGESGDFSDSLIDNLFVTQNTEFDFLVGMDGSIPKPTGDQIYVPIAMAERFSLQVGDELLVATAAGAKSFSIQGFVRDAQMASSLSSATRYLVSDQGLQELIDAGGGSQEIIVEYRLKDPADIDALQQSYDADAALPKNGQAVTDTMIRLINAVSDGLVAIALIFGSFLLIVIALINLRFVIRGSLQDDVREIGAMKAIGIPNRSISSLYLGKYSIMMLVSCMVGGLLAIAATAALTQSIQASYSSAPVTVVSVLVPVLALLLVFVLVVLLCWGVLRSVSRIEVVSALVHGSTLTQKQAAREGKKQAARVKRTHLVKYRGSLNRALSMLDLRQESGQWILLPIIFFLAAVLMVLPMNLLSTFQSPKFVTYMGAPQSDLRADIQFADGIDAIRDKMVAQLDGDDRITDVRPVANVLMRVDGPEGEESLRVEVGDGVADRISYVHGGAPSAGEIAVSVLNADKLAVAVGDSLHIAAQGAVQKVRVSGIYQDVTSGGYTAKMTGTITSGAVGYVIYADVVSGSNPETIAAEYRKEYAPATVYPMQEYVSQTLSYLTTALSSATLISFVFGAGIALLITCLFLKLRLSKDKRKIGVLSSIGFSVSDLRSQISFKTTLMVVIGTILGVLFAATAGEALVSGVVAGAGLGIDQLTFLPNVWVVYVLYPIVLIGAGLLGVIFLTAGLSRADKSTWLKG
ncbi:MAG: ABC transporter permease [Actinomycetales bacterium]